MQRPKKTARYDEDDPEAYKDMPVPDKVGGLNTTSSCCQLFAWTGAAYDDLKVWGRPGFFQLELLDMCVYCDLVGE